jgi:o-succinylbenzoate---CoA ligase
MDRFVDFLNSKKDWILLNPRMQTAERERQEQLVEGYGLGEHVWLMSSGTESQRGGRRKMVALSKAALLAAAQGVNEFFSITKKDVIYNSLPQFHVAGLLQMARAHVAGAELVHAPELAWDVHTYCEALNTTHTTVTSLVPTQIYDLVQTQKKAPATLRLVFAGGGALSDFLLEEAQKLGWPLLRTYGMTETSAMVAYKEATSQMWRRLPHLHRWESTAEQKIKLFGPSLLSGYLLMEGGRTEWIDPKQQGWFESDDRGLIEKDGLVLLGRESEIVKVKGETVSLLEMNERWQRFCQTHSLSGNSVIIALPHARDGHELVMVTEECVQIEQIQPFQNELLPFQKIQRVYAKTLIPRTDLGKIKTADLIKSLQ